MDLLGILLIAAALGSGVAGGVFFAFSGFVVQGLDLNRADVAARAMRGINVTALRPPLMLVLFGTAIVAAVAAVLAITGAGGDATWWVVGASALYVVGAVIVTAVGNVPRNVALAGTTDTDPALGEAWRAFRPRWMAWNHVRTVACVLATAGYVIALIVR